jgi:hypothetical protein
MIPVNQLNQEVCIHILCLDIVQSAIDASVPLYIKQNVLDVCQAGSESLDEIAAFVRQVQKVLTCESL